jgi:hypothetical protein
VTFLTGATYLHFLVGGFWFLALQLLDWLQFQEIRTILARVGIYALAASPLVALVLYDQVILQAGIATPEDGLSADYIYSILRNPHHVAPFSDRSVLRDWLPGAAIALALATGLVPLIRRVHDRERRVLVWIWILLCYLITAFALSAFDADSGRLGKFYLLRPSALILFCLVAAGFLLIEGHAARTAGAVRLVYRATTIGVALCMLGGLGWSCLQDIRGERFSRWEPTTELLELLRQRAQPSEIVLLDPAVDTRYQSALAARLDRPRMVNWKFVPTNAKSIYRWYDLLRYRDRVFAGACEELENYPVRLLLTDAGPDRPASLCGELIWQDGTWSVVDVRQRPRERRGPE